MPQQIALSNPEPVRLPHPRAATTQPWHAEAPAPRQQVEDTQPAEQAACAAHWAY